MTFLYSDKIEKMIEEHNVNVLSGDMQENVNKFIRRICLHIAMYSREVITEQTQELRQYLKSCHFEDLFCKWLESEDIYTIHFDIIYAIFIETEILKDSESIQKFSGFAYSFGGKFYIFVQHKSSIDSTVSILVHEIIHVELEAIFQSYEADAEIRFSEELKEEAVIFTEHYALCKILGITLDDLSTELRKKYKDFSQLAEKGIRPAIYRWMERERIGNYHG